MDTFNTNKHKIHSLYNSKTNNKNLIEQKTNDLSNIPLDVNYFRNLHLLVDSGIVNLEAVESTYKNLERNNKVPIEFSYLYENYLYLNQCYFPFIDWMTAFLLPKDYDILPMLEFKEDDWEDTYKVTTTTPTNILYQGLPLPLDFAVSQNRSFDLVTVNQDSVDNNQTIIKYKLPAWKIYVEWTSAGNQYRILDGLFCGYLSKTYDITTSECGGGEDYSYLEGAYWINSKFPAGFPPLYEIFWFETSFASGYVDFSGNNLETVLCHGTQHRISHQGTPGLCEEFHTSTANVINTFDLKTTLHAITIYGKRQKYNGKICTSGFGVPLNSFGNNGDFYVNTITGYVYTKSFGSWGEPDTSYADILVSLSASWFDGTSLPNDGVGINGDFYIRSVGGDIYQKENNIWGSPILSLNSAGWINNPNSNINYYSLLTSDIDIWSPIQNNYLAYFDSNFYYILNGLYSNIIQLAVLPPLSVGYASIKFTINPTKISDRLGEKQNTFFISPDVGTADPFFIRLSKTQDSRESWRVKIGFSALSFSEANVSSMIGMKDLEIDYIPNLFTQVYAGTIVKNTTVQKERWLPELPNVTTRVIAYVRNHLYFKKTQTFNTKVS